MIPKKNPRIYLRKSQNQRRKNEKAEPFPRRARVLDKEEKKNLRRVRQDRGPFAQNVMNLRDAAAHNERFDQP